MSDDKHSAMARALQRRLVLEAREEQPAPGAQKRAKQAVALAAIATIGTRAGAQVSATQLSGSSLLGTFAASTTAKVSIALLLSAGVAAGYVHKRSAAHETIETAATVNSDNARLEAIPTAQQQQEPHAADEPAAAPLPVARATASTRVPAPVASEPAESGLEPAAPSEAPAPVPLERPAPAASALQVELAEIDAVQALVRSGKLDDASKVLAQYFEAHASGRLMPEARLLEINLLRAQGRSAEAVSKTDAYLKLYPDSPGAKKLQREDAQK